LGTLLGDWHTEQYIAAVINDPHQAEQARQALEQAGWKPEDVRLVRGKPAAEQIETIEEHRSLPERLGAAVRGTTSEEGPISEAYEDEAEQGHQILAAYATDPQQVEQARQILAQHQAHDVEYFGSWVITDLPAHEEAPPGV
jgi:hypothetical protein